MRRRRQKMKKKVWFGIIAAAMVMACAGCSKKADSETVPKDLFANLATVDFEGNEVTADIFKENDLTLINTWATWCGPCVGEIPELQEVSDELEKEGTKVAIKGLVIEVMEGNTNELGIYAGLSEKERKNVQEVLDATKATYQQLLVSEELAASSLGKQAGFPTTYFVDKNGELVGAPITGSEDKAGWKKIIEKRLEEVKNEK